MFASLIIYAVAVAGPSKSKLSVVPGASPGSYEIQVNGKGWFTSGNVSGVGWPAHR
jgi:hypothetical protein